MIPIQLSLSGFLSYRDPVEIDFTTFDLACISGPNGAGKSSLLDAMTYALFGQARKWDESLINNQSEKAQVVFTFAYEGNIYRTQRSNPRGKTSNLEFYIHQGELDDQGLPTGPWKPLTERTLRETQLLIENTLRLDYETFINASFFLQGKADQFTQQRPGDRKRILSSILGLEIWEEYRKRTADRRRTVELEINSLDGALAEINAELAEEEPRTVRLKELQTELKRLSKVRSVHESNLDNIRKITATLTEQRRLVDTLARQLEVSQRSLGEMQVRLHARRDERQSYSELLAREEAINAAYNAWLQTRQDLERWEEIANRFREHDLRRQEPLREIDAARERLSQEAEMLRSQQARIVEQSAVQGELQSQIGEVQEQIKQSEDKLSQKSTLDDEMQTARQRQYEARAENPVLKAEMDELKERINQLSQVEDAVCPLCGQPLSPDERQALVVQLKAQGSEMGDKYRANKALLEAADNLVNDLERRIAEIGPVEREIQSHTQRITLLMSRLEQTDTIRKEWEVQGYTRLVEINQQLEDEAYAANARAKLAEIDAELKAIGYDAAAHDATRKRELDERSAQDDLNALERAKAALAPLEREISELELQVQTLLEQVEQLQMEHTESAAVLAAGEAQAPDLQAAEDELFKLQEQENRLRMEVGAAQQKVLVLNDLRARKKELNIEREDFARMIGHYKQLERSFSKDGVPALLIEQAIPQIETSANEILDRLSAGNMSVRFTTQAAYKDKRRDDLRETLDIQISDSAGTRDYEMYSGGEAFRVNFALRLALSEVLARRAGARLQTLIIDEGFGSQDALGRQRLIEAINLIRPDFAKILVITHIEELKEAFPTRIEVEKTDRGSTIQVI
jgi:DNA repair protein SbcC/Rad50